ncbi:nitroreductase family protein [Rhodothalassium salexigens]|uniref:nitroreductase family protein n=1 Tax=Rhodothalassium salexigens TaxID=1086 RepID=UPI001911E92C|nr:nitroreductase family protein [Rhodothalassium salexigens]
MAAPDTAPTTDTPPADIPTPETPKTGAATTEAEPATAPRLDAALARLPDPAKGDALAAMQPSPETLALLARRRSTKVKDGMTGPAPEGAALAGLLRLAARVPDHRQVVPFRFVTIAGPARGRLGRVAADALAADGETSEAKLALERGRFERAPLVVAVVARTEPAHKTPEWEQVLSVGAVCQTLMIAAHAAGYAAQWLTEWVAYDDRVRAALGLAPGERVAGFVYLGQAAGGPVERARPDMAALVSACPV